MDNVGIILLDCTGTTGNPKIIAPLLLGWFVQLKHLGNSFPFPALSLQLHMYPRLLRLFQKSSESKYVLCLKRFDSASNELKTSVLIEIAIPESGIPSPAMQLRYHLGRGCLWAVADRARKEAGWDADWWLVRTSPIIQDLSNTPSLGVSRPQGFWRVRHWNPGPDASRTWWHQQGWPSDGRKILVCIHGESGHCLMPDRTPSSRHRLGKPHRIPASEHVSPCPV